MDFLIGGSHGFRLLKNMCESRQYSGGWGSHGIGDLWGLCVGQQQQPPACRGHSRENPPAQTRSQLQWCTNGRNQFHINYSYTVSVSILLYAHSECLLTTSRVFRLKLASTAHLSSPLMVQSERVGRAAMGAWDWVTQTTSPLLRSWPLNLTVPLRKFHHPKAQTATH